MQRLRELALADAGCLRKSSMWLANFNREFACKQRVHVEMWQVLEQIQTT